MLRQALSEAVWLRLLCRATGRPHSPHWTSTRYDGRCDGSIIESMGTTTHAPKCPVSLFVYLLIYFFQSQQVQPPQNGEMVRLKCNEHADHITAYNIMHINEMFGC